MYCCYCHYYYYCYYSRTGGDERVATLGEDLHQVVCQVATGQIQTHDGMGQSIALIDRHVVGHTVSRVQDNTWTWQIHIHTH